MSNCLECNAELTQTPGKRPKQYCGNSCRVKYHLKQKNKGKVPGKRGRPAKSKENAPPLPPPKKETPPSAPTDNPSPKNDKMPDGLGWKEQLEWKRNNKK